MIELDGTFAFVHAGINPDRAINDQARKDCLWIRESFFEYDAPLSHVVVHGHTVTESRRPTVASNRIAVDTEAYSIDNLTAVIIDPAVRSVNFAWTTPSEFGVRVASAEPIWLDTPKALLGRFRT